MRLIVESKGGEVFAYIEEERHFKKLGRNILDSHQLLKEECCLDDRDDFTLVFDLKPKQEYEKGAG